MGEKMTDVQMSMLIAGVIFTILGIAMLVIVWGST